MEHRIVPAEHVLTTKTDSEGYACLGEEYVDSMVTLVVVADIDD